MTQHTPGPWHVRASFDTDVVGADGYVLADAAGVHLAEMWDGNSGHWALVPGSHRDICEHEAAANARLIAAAPELLALAEAYSQWEADLILSDEAWADGMAPLPTLTQQLYDRFIEIQTMRNAAVKKAKGGTA